eukprot:8245301-Pyramimonas_sp.AAC.1
MCYRSGRQRRTSSNADISTKRLAYLQEWGAVDTMVVCIVVEKMAPFLLQMKTEHPFWNKLASVNHRGAGGRQTCSDPAFSLAIPRSGKRRCARPDELSQ